MKKLHMQSAQVERTKKRQTDHAEMDGINKKLGDALAKGSRPNEKAESSCWLKLKSHILI